MNPYLTVLMIGLIVLNLTCIAMLATRLPITHGASFDYGPPSLDRASSAQPR